MLRRGDLGALLSFLGDYNRRGDWLNFCCPFHKGSRKNFGVLLKSQKFTCLGCEAQGSLYDLFQDLFPEGGGEDTGLLEMIELEAQNEATGGLFGKPESVVLVSEYPGSKWAGGYKSLANTSWSSISEKKAAEYLQSRRVDWTAIEAGTHENLPGYVTFPFRDADGGVEYYVARDFTGAQLRVRNPSREEGWKGSEQVLFNAAKMPADRVLITEGIFDALAAPPGYVGTCLLGQRISLPQIQILRRAGPREIVVMLDADARGASVEVTTQLYEEGFTVRIAEWDSGNYKDPSAAPPDLVRRMADGARQITYGELFRLRVQG